MIGIKALALALGIAWAFGSPDVRQATGPEPVVMLATDRLAYEPGVPVAFAIAVDNPADAPVTLTFPSRQTYDIVVLDGEREVWRWSSDRFFATAMTELTVPPGVVLLGRERWDGRDASGAPVPVGTYRVVANLATNPPKPGNAVELRLGSP